MRLLLIPLLLVTTLGISTVLVPPQASAIDTSNPKVKAYPLDTCPISGEKLGSHGDTITMIYKGQQVKFSSKASMELFEKDISGNLTKVKAAITAYEKTLKPTEKPPTKPAEKPATKPAEKPATKPAEKPATKPADKMPEKKNN